MQMITCSYVCNMAGKRLNLAVPATFRYNAKTSTAADLPMPGPDSWQTEGTDFGNQAEDVICWLHQFTQHLTNRYDRQESLKPATLEYRPTPRSRKWRTAHTRPRYIPTLHDLPAAQLAYQEDWADWRYVEALPRSRRIPR